VEGGPLVGGDWRRGLNVERGRMILMAVEVGGFERRARGRVVRSVRDILGECCWEEEKVRVAVLLESREEWVYFLEGTSVAFSGILMLDKK
jgi:hypothetical protein